jgi:acyl dehydratase
VRGEQRMWEDVQVGDEIEGFELDITPRRAVLQISGSQDWYPVHFDKGFARKAGHEGIFMNTGFMQAALVRVITDWMGDDGFLRRVRFELRRQQRIGDTIVCRGKVTAKYEENGDACVELDVWAENEREGVTTPGHAVVVLPRRSRS